MLRNIIKNLPALVIGLALSFILMEVGVRVSRGALFDTTLLSADYAESEDKVHEGREPRAVYDSYLGWIPNVGVVESGGLRYTVLDGNVRSNGPDALSKGHSSPIVVTGDSFAFGDEVGDFESWPARLEEAIGSRVINGAVFGYGLDQIVLRSELLVERYAPSLLLLSYIPDDIVRSEMSLREHAKPYFVVEPDGTPVLKNVPVPRQGGTGRRPDFIRGVLGYSHLVDFVMRRVAVNYWLDHRVVLADLHRAERGSNSTGPRVGCALMGRLAKLKKSTEIVIVAQYLKELGPNYRRLSLGLIECARDNGLRVLDLYDPLSEVKEREPEIFREFYRWHMTSEGNAFVAGRVREFLLEEGLL